MTKYIFVTGGVVSGLGKGITAASLGRILKARGLKVAAQKLDPYINVDPGTMSPYQHGEVYVTEDGAEISTSATTSASSTRILTNTRISPPVKYTGTCSTKSAAASISARPFRSYPI